MEHFKLMEVGQEWGHLVTLIGKQDWLFSLR